MKRILTVVTVVIMTALSAYSQPQAANSGQAPCRLKTSQAPAVRGIRLGMTAEELHALFPESPAENLVRSVSKAADYPHFGVAGFNINPSHYSTKERFTGIGSFNFVLLDGRLAQYEVHYRVAPDGPTWRNVDDFIAKIADAFELPAAKNWLTFPHTTSTKALTCDGFQMEASNVNLRGSLKLATVDTPFKVQQQRLAAFEEKARHDFRP